jgi:hypothetical protein
MAKTKKKTKNLRSHAGELADMVAPHVEHARDKAAPVLAEARQKAAPYVAEARDKAAPALSEAKLKLTNEVLPVLTAAIAAANEATEDVREEAKKRGKATAAALKGDLQPPKKKKHRLRRLLTVLGLGGAVFAVVKKLSDRDATTAWQSSYTPPPAPPAPPAPPSATTVSDPAGAHRAEAGDDEGGASPDVAAADAAAEPHPASTPDQPAEEIDVTKKD